MPIPNMQVILPENSNRGIAFCGLRVNCAAIARHCGLSKQWVSFLLNGEQEGMIGHYIKIAGLLGMSIDDLLIGIEERKGELKKLADVALASYRERIAKENEEAMAARLAGRPVVPQMSAFRLPKDRVVISPRKNHTPV